MTAGTYPIYRANLHDVRKQMSTHLDAVDDRLDDLEFPSVRAVTGTDTVLAGDYTVNATSETFTNEVIEAIQKKIG